MAELTKEWLQKTIAQLEEERDALPGAVNEDAANALAAMKLALASLEAKSKLSNFIATQESLGVAFERVLAENIEELYVPSKSTPPAPVSVKIPPEKPHTDGPLADGWNACRAAMLQGADQAPVKQPSSNSVLGWLRADYQDDNRGLRGNAPLFVLGKKDPSTVWGLDYIPLTSNSPVLPDGWVACSERLPPEGYEPDGGAVCYLVWHKNEVDCGPQYSISNVFFLRKHWEKNFTHWMPLPETPQQEGE